MDSLTHFLYTLSFVLIPLASAIVLHEYAHGWVANYFGDSIESYPSHRSNWEYPCTPVFDFSLSRWLLIWLG